MNSQAIKRQSQKLLRGVLRRRCFGAGDFDLLAVLLADLVAVLRGFGAAPTRSDFDRRISPSVLLENRGSIRLFEGGLRAIEAILYAKQG